MKGISFQASLYKFTTLVDGGGRLTLDIPESEMQQMSEVMQMGGRNLQVGIVDENCDNNAMRDENGSW
jgi:hypothetical protein